jgi:hypothetical protein
MYRVKIVCRTFRSGPSADFEIWFSKISRHQNLAKKLSSFTDYIELLLNRLLGALMNFYSIARSYRHSLGFQRGQNV